MRMLRFINRLVGFFKSPAQKPELSFSKMQTYRECPYRYYLSYVERWHAPPTPHSSLGHSIHKTLERFHQVNGTSMEDLMQAYTECWEHEGFSDPTEEMLFYERGEHILRNYYEQNSKRTSRILAMEKDFSIDLKFCTLRGIIDRIDRLPDGTIELIDYKTHKQMWKNKAIRNDLQLTIYKYACSRALGLQPGTLSYYFLSHNKKVSTTRDKNDERMMLSMLKETAGKINRQEYQPRFKFCWKCDFKERCRHANKKNSPDRH
ncbi:MAG: Dna2/Cas4 domain-containing protein [Elusimicrobia bacterium]|nr:Dna2/Cas4 domain-containing protein [Elusimicrobiota bacterium]MBD3411746.1 Dna2/Cas4 domain-containing protein [Elusimicrobiota bacterium]